MKSVLDEGVIRAVRVFLQFFYFKKSLVGKIILIKIGFDH